MDRNAPAPVTPLLVLGVAEVPPPEESLVWMLIDHAQAALTDRAERTSESLVMPEVLRLRFLTDRVPGLLRASRRAVVVTGTRWHGGDADIRHTHHHFADTLLAGAAGLAGSPAGDRGAGAVALLPDTVADAATAWELLLATRGADLLPLGGLDHYEVPLPARGAPTWLLPHLGTWLPGMSQALADGLWRIMLGEALKLHPNRVA